MLTRKPLHTSSDFKNVIFEKIPWAPPEVAEVAEFKQPLKPKITKILNENS